MRYKVLLLYMMIAGSVLGVETETEMTDSVSLPDVEVSVSRIARPVTQ